MDDKLQKVILAMDSYNRGYNEGIILEKPEDVPNTWLGDFQIRAQSAVIPKSDAYTHGFYAIAYQYPDSSSATQTVIAYRGTDQFLSSGSGNTFIGGDIFNAYGITICGLPCANAKLQRRNSPTRDFLAD